MFRCRFIVEAVATACLLVCGPTSHAGENTAPASVASTNAPAPDTETIARLVSGLQERLNASERETQAARAEAVAASARAAELLRDRVASLEARQADAEHVHGEALQASSRRMLEAVAIVAGLCLVFLVSASLQARAMNRVAAVCLELEKRREASWPAPAGYGQIANVKGGEPSAAVQASSAKVSDALDRLQRQVEHLAGANGGANAVQPVKELPAAAVPMAAVLIAKGQTLLSLDKPVDALACFNEALTAEPRHVEAWIKKGTALERLDRTDEAMAAYDKAIALDDSAATPYLLKGGMYNRQKKYAEALQCYEKALHVQKIRSPAAVN